jgi:hypothetical protein
MNTKKIITRVFIGVVALLALLYLVSPMADSLERSHKSEAKLMAEQAGGKLEEYFSDKARFSGKPKPEDFFKAPLANDFFFEAEKVCPELKSKLSEEMMPFINETSYRLLAIRSSWAAIKNRGEAAVVVRIGKASDSYCKPK